MPIIQQYKIILLNIHSQVVVYLGLTTIIKKEHLFEYSFYSQIAKLF